MWCLGIDRALLRQAEYEDFERPSKASTNPIDIDPDCMQAWVNKGDTQIGRPRYRDECCLRKGKGWDARQMLAPA
jgi:hypothetical protein